MLTRRIATSTVFECFHAHRRSCRGIRTGSSRLNPPLVPGGSDSFHSLRYIRNTHTYHSLRYIYGTHTRTTHCDIHARSTEAYTHLPKVPLSDASASLCSPCQRQSTQHIAHITQHDNTCRQHGTPPQRSPVRCLSDQTQ